MPGGQAAVADPQNKQEAEDRSALPFTPCLSHMWFRFPRQETAGQRGGVGGGGGGDIYQSMSMGGWWWWWGGVGGGCERDR